ncbi:drug/metabolite DMT transporter permease [Acinetobacter chinensis]|uniref:Drug/metabolite DMT transporter permease n=1 Tax=Acinetobacter chinensis TaxID=2004650 RepID=A0A3B7M285_9GAMM|nr:aromatic amino acid DMT transporter YddG [Acinetobacter chinensis]AXY56733.1 drug/metabolite DMT transporter permease [Acinetobacter chinensis]
MSRNLATLIGFSAILQWSSIVGLLKKVSFDIGADLAVTFMYSISALILLVLFKIPDLKLLSRGYLIFATLLFVVYELCFSYAIALAQTAQQAIEVSLVNYLWPSMTILFLILFKELKFNILVLCGLGISMSGIVLIQSGSGSFEWGTVLQNLQANPVSYMLAFVGAALWSLYCVITKKYSNGHNPITLFFLAITAVLWLKMLLIGDLTPLANMSFSTLGYLLILSTVTGLGYAVWNIGIIQGNITVLVALSYFSPIFSSVISMFILQTALTVNFWHGAVLVTAGSLLCWISTNWQLLKNKFFYMFNGKVL